MEGVAAFVGAVFSWPVAVVVLALVFRGAIEGKLASMSSLTVKDWLALKFEADAMALGGPATSAAPETPDGRPAAVREGAASPAQPQLHPLTPDDVVNELGTIGELQEVHIRRDLPQVCRALQSRDIVTREQLHDLVANDDILNTIRVLYTTELKRPPERALDPIAVAFWGGSLYRYGVSQDTREALRQAIRKSPEYAAMH
jgi:hypothetical protein